METTTENTQKKEFKSIHHGYVPVFTNEIEYINDDIMNELKSKLEPFYSKLEPAKIYDFHDKSEIISEIRNSKKTTIFEDDIFSFLNTNILPIINNISEKYNQTFQIIKSHLDLVVYDGDNYFNGHHDFIGDHTNFSHQYTLIIGLVNSNSGNTLVWDSEDKEYKTYNQSINKGGLLWFCSDINHLSEKIKKNDRKEILTVQLRAFKINEEKEEKDLVLLKSTENTEYYIEKDLIKNTLFNNLIEINNSNENNNEEGSSQNNLYQIQTNLDNNKLQKIIQYIKKEKDFTTEEMEDIREILNFYMINHIDFRECKISSKYLHYINENFYDKDFIVFDKFEPWMIQWSKDMGYIPFQFVFYWTDFRIKDSEIRKLGQSCVKQVFKYTEDNPTKWKDLKNQINSFSNNNNKNYSDLNHLNNIKLIINNNIPFKVFNHSNDYDFEENLENTEQNVEELNNYEETKDDEINNIDNIDNIDNNDNNDNINEEYLYQIKINKDRKDEIISNEKYNLLENFNEIFKNLLERDFNELKYIHRNSNKFLEYLYSDNRLNKKYFLDKYNINILTLNKNELFNFFGYIFNFGISFDYELYKKLNLSENTIKKLTILTIKSSDWNKCYLLFNKIREERSQIFTEILTNNNNNDFEFPFDDKFLNINYELNNSKNYYECFDDYTNEYVLNNYENRDYELLLMVNNADLLCATNELAQVWNYIHSFNSENINIPFINKIRSIVHYHQYRNILNYSRYNDDYEQKYSYNINSLNNKKVKPLFYDKTHFKIEYLYTIMDSKLVDLLIGIRFYNIINYLNINNPIIHLDENNPILNSHSFNNHNEESTIKRKHNVSFKKFEESNQSFDYINIDKNDFNNIKNIVNNLSLSNALQFRDNIYEFYSYEDSGCNDDGGDQYHSYENYHFNVYYVYFGFYKKKN